MGFRLKFLLFAFFRFSISFEVFVQDDNVCDIVDVDHVPPVQLRTRTHAQDRVFIDVPNAVEIPKCSIVTYTICDDMLFERHLIYSRKLVQQPKTSKYHWLSCCGKLLAKSPTGITTRKNDFKFFRIKIMSGHYRR